MLLATLPGPAGAEPHGGCSAAVARSRSAAAGARADAAPVAGGGPPAGWRLVFEDRFRTLSRATWTPSAEQGFGYEWFVPPGDPAIRPFSVVADAAGAGPGALRIAAGPMPADAASRFPALTRGRPTHFGGLISTHDSFAMAAPLYIEARMKLSANPAAWPAFWTLGCNRQAWPSPLQYAKQWENDVMETFGNATSYAVSLHWNDKVGSPAAAADYPHETIGIDLHGVDLSRSFHVFASLMTERGVVWFLDGREVARRPYPPDADWRQPQYLILDLAFGFPWDRGAPLPRSDAAIEIDDVRAYAPSG